MNISIYKKINFTVSEEKIRNAVETVFKKSRVTGETEASVAIVSHAEMIDYAMKYMGESRQEAQEHPVLSFPTSELESPFVFPPDKINHIGEIVVSYEKAQEYAKKENRFVEDVIADLAEHGALHLVGIHHD